nr:MAG TPA: hypothetical protein [Caudoviricetes sp.]
MYFTKRPESRGKILLSISMQKALADAGAFALWKGAEHDSTERRY